MHKHKNVAIVNSIQLIAPTTCSAEINIKYGFCGKLSFENPINTKTRSMS
jgi:hypothetical protein